MEDFEPFAARAGSARFCGEAGEPADVIWLRAQRNSRLRQFFCLRQDDVAGLAANLEARGGVQKFLVGPLGFASFAQVRSALSMLTFHINRSGRSLPASLKRVLERAKAELKHQFGRD